MDGFVTRVGHIELIGAETDDSIVNSVINSTDNRNSSAKKKPKGGSSNGSNKPWFVNAELSRGTGSRLQGNARAGCHSRPEEVDELRALSENSHASVVPHQCDKIGDYELPYVPRYPI